MAEPLMIITPFGRPDPGLCVSAIASGAIGVLDLGRGDQQARAAVRETARRATGPFGVRVGFGCALSPDEVWAEVDDAGGSIGTVVLGWGGPWRPDLVRTDVVVLAEVVSPDEAHSALDAGAAGIVARGHEAGGRVSDLGSFVLLQTLRNDLGPATEIWLAGGVGPHTAPAALVGGATGVVLDAHLALTREAGTAPDLAAALRSPAGVDTTVVGGHRVIARRPGAAAGLHADSAPSDPITEHDVAARIADGSLVPAGLDAAMAKEFATRFGSTRRSVAAMRGALVAAVSSSGRLAVSPGSRMADALGCRLPVAQGPMTRVSDVAAFAASVARHDALPFVALSLLSGTDSQELLERVQVAVEGRAWGVGVLGFAPEELRAEQLAAVRAIRPSVALIAGGRPAQAAELEADGIITFLHVPSPDLLRQFLDAGARRFVFEGSECGGHIGPRTSFALWECQIQVLVDHIDAGGSPEELHVLLAGGIHDARSSAMAATAASALTSRGAAVGILMGTAYLFTEEAVSEGAIHSTFQLQALAAGQTTVVESAPGHAIRCLPNPYTEDFARTRSDLLAQGLPRQQVWAELEERNVGRLRVASKGLKRVGDDLVRVTDREQVDEGLFMAGQAAVLRSAVTTVDQLHAEVTAGAADFHAARTEVLRARVGAATTNGSAAPAPLDVAIVGMACMFPGAPDLPSYWARTVANTDSISEVRPERWNPEVYYSPDGGLSDGTSTPSKWGGFLDPVPFDPLRYGIPPTALPAIEPAQLLAVEVADRALQDAGCRPGHFDAERTGVVFGAEPGSDLSSVTDLRLLLPSLTNTVPEEMDRQLPRLTEDTFAGRLANVIAGRVANRLDFGGPNYTVDAACASSLAAVDVACKELVSGSSDLMLAGAVDLHNAVDDYLLFASVGALSPRGRCRTFDASADGIALGEGVACLVLKRLADAERDGDRVYAVVSGVGASSDGRALGLTAPRPEGQRRAIDRAYRSAGLVPSQVGLIEAHGTGTVVGDRTELETLTKAFAEAGGRPGACVLGSVKSQIGHTKCAAGLAGMIRTAMGVYTGVLPPTHHIEEPNPAWDPANSPFTFRNEAAPWTAPGPERVAGVSAFGFGGTNFHVVLRGHQSGELEGARTTDWPVELFTFRGEDRAGALAEVGWLAALIDANDTQGRPWKLKDLARTLALRSDAASGAVQSAAVAGDLDELADQVGGLLQGDIRPGVLTAPQDGGGPGHVAILFPGQGSQQPGMLAELFVAFPEVRNLVPVAEEVWSAMFPGAAFGNEHSRSQRETLSATTVAQPALGVTGTAAAHLLARAGVTGDMLGGHSYGELVALTAAGTMSPATLMRLTSARAGAMVAAADGRLGTMAAVNAEHAAVQAVLDGDPQLDGVVIANYNSPRQVVISGPALGIEGAIARLKAEGHAATRLPVGGAFHSPMMSDAEDPFRQALGSCSLRVPDRPVWSNRTAGPYPGELSAIRTELAAQIVSPVRFADEVVAMYEAGARTFIEAGPGRVLTGLVRSVLGDRPHHTVNLDGGLRGFLSALAQLAVLGVPLQTRWLTDGRDAGDLSDRPVVRQAGWQIDGQLVRTADGEPVPGGLAPLRRQQGSWTGDSSAGEAEDTMLSEYLRTSRELVTAQRDVMLAFYGAPSTGERVARSEPVPSLEPVAAAVSGGQSAPPSDPGIPSQPPVRSEDLDPLEVVRQVIGDRTGYPLELIAPDLDLEADLSIDSIKRTEIASEVCALLGIAATDHRFDDVIRQRTARAMAAATGTPATATAPGDGPEPGVAVDAGGGPEPVATTDSPAEQTGPRASTGLPAAETEASPAPEGEAPLRFVTAAVPSASSPTSGESGVSGWRVVLHGGRPSLASAMSDRLTRLGATVSHTEQLRSSDPLDAVILLDALESAAPSSVLPHLLPSVQAALQAGVRRLVLVARAAEPAPSAAASGLRGFVRCVALEHPEARPCLLELQPADDEALVGAIVDELCGPGTEPVVQLGAEARMAPTVIRSDVPPVGQDEVADHEIADRLGLAPDSVVLLVGGARGITARFALEIAALCGNQIELSGRTVLDRDRQFSVPEGMRELSEIRATLAREGQWAPNDLDRTARQILAGREVEATIAGIRERGGHPTYRTVDVTDTHGVAQLVKQVHAERGRIDGVVFSAGVIEDRLLMEKDAESFGRVFSTKVDGVRALLGALEELPDQPSFVVLFGSVAAVIGSRGQADYGAANDAMDNLATNWGHRTGTRVLTVHWGPWAPSPDELGGGMVNPALARHYARQGVAMIEPRSGVRSLLRELAFGPRDLRSVVWAAPAPWTHERP